MFKLSDEDKRDLPELAMFFLGCMVLTAAAGLIDLDHVVARKEQQVVAPALPEFQLLAQIDSKQVVPTNQQNADKLSYDSFILGIYETSEAR